MVRDFSRKYRGKFPYLLAALGRVMYRSEAWLCNKLPLMHEPATNALILNVILLELPCGIIEDTTELALLCGNKKSFLYGSSAK